MWIPAYVCVKVGHGLDSRECFSWQAPAGVGVGGRGPRQGHVRLSRQRPADWVVTELGQSASASQALQEGEGLSLRGWWGAGTTLF